MLNNPDSDPDVPSLQPQLPLELLSYTVGFIAHNEPEWENSDEACLYSEQEIEARKTLLACSLASRTLRHVTLPYLFHTLALYAGPTVGNIQHGPFRNLQEFQEFLDGYPAICQVIREIRICGITLSDNYYALVGAEIAIIRLVNVFQRLPRLRILVLQDVHLYSSSHEMRRLRGLRSTLPALDRFCFYITPDIETTYIDLSLTVLPLMSCFAEVKEVSLDEVGIVLGDLGRITYLPAGLRSLKLSDCTYVESFLSAVSRDVSKHSIPTPLETLELCCMRMDALDKVADLLSLVGPTLREVSFCFGDMCGLGSLSSTAQDIELLRLSSCSRLESFTLRWMIWLQPPELMLAQVGTILSFLEECPCIHEVTLRIRMIGGRKWLQERLAMLSGPVENELLKRNTLTKVKIVLPKQMDMSWYPTFIRKVTRVNFPNLYRKGLF